MSQVSVTYHREREGWWAESPDVPGYTAAGNTFAEVRALVQDGLPFLLDTDAVVISERLADGAALTAPSSPQNEGVSAFFTLPRSFAAVMTAGPSMQPAL